MSLPPLSGIEDFTLLLKTSEGKTFVVEIDSDGNGQVLPAHGFDRVRVRGFEIDNEDSLFYIDSFLEDEWDALVDQAIRARAEAWLEKEEVKKAVEHLGEVDKALDLLEKEYKSARREVLRERVQHFDRLRNAAARVGGFTLTQQDYFWTDGAEKDVVILEGRIDVQDRD